MSVLSVIYSAVSPCSLPCMYTSALQLGCCLMMQDEFRSDDSFEWLLIYECVNPWPRMSWRWATSSSAFFHLPQHFIFVCSFVIYRILINYVTKLYYSDFQVACASSESSEVHLYDIETATRGPTQVKHSFINFESSIPTSKHLLVAMMILCQKKRNDVRYEHCDTALSKLYYRYPLHEMGVVSRYQGHWHEKSTSVCAPILIECDSMSTSAMHTLCPSPARCWQEGTVVDAWVWGEGSAMFVTTRDHTPGVKFCLKHTCTKAMWITWRMIPLAWITLCLSRECIKSKLNEGEKQEIRRRKKRRKKRKINNKMFGPWEACRVVACGQEGSVNVWDRRASKRRPCSTMTPPRPLGPLNCLQLSGDGQVRKITKTKKN